MKFMQRAAASATPAGSPDSESHSSKKRKLGHSPSEGRMSMNIDQAAIQAALDDQEAKRQAALEKHGVGADTHWVLNTAFSQTKPAKAPMNIVYVGYGDIDTSDESGDNEDAPAIGRTSTKDYKKQPKRTTSKEESDASDDSSDSDSDDSDESSSGRKRKPSSDSPNSRSDRSRSRSQSMSRRKSAESAKAKEFREKRKKKEVRLNKLTSISSSGGGSQYPAHPSPTSKSLTCYKCQQPGHKAVDCPKVGNSRVFQKSDRSKSRDSNRSASPTTQDSKGKAPAASEYGMTRKRDREDEPNLQLPQSPNPRTPVYRSQAESKKCRQQDNDRCIVTGTRDPMVCHIVPFAWNSTASNLRRTSTLLATIAFALGSVDDTEGLMAVLDQQLGATDKAWNMLALSPMLHVWWGKGFFALKYLGATPVVGCREQSGIELQFHWMPRSPDHDARREINLNNQRDDQKSLLRQLDHYYGNGASPTCDANRCELCPQTDGVGAHEISTHRLIRSGSIISVRRDTASAQYFRVMIEIQWAIIRAAAMSGAAQAPDLLQGPSDNDDDDSAWGIDQIREWERGVTPEYEEDSRERFI
ncbi:Fc.00g112590.m01.CDS01 [Cosmosporella sp. VM-42]